MKILVTGANGFIGRHLVSALLGSGHNVVPAVRRPADLNGFLKQADAISIDFNRDTEPGIWLPRLAGIDAVINCAGILQGRPGQDIEAIHHTGPTALFQACEMADVGRVVQISAISAVADAGTHYATSKLRADEFLKTTNLNWTIVKPSLVFGAGAYGGTALLRGLAALPFVTPLVGDGLQKFRPLSMDDLCGLIVATLEKGSDERAALIVVGPEELTLKQIMADLRDWLGFPTGRELRVSKTLVRLVAKLGDIAGGEINSTAYKQLEFGNSGESKGADEQLRTTNTTWREGLTEYPSQTQDRWHARLYFLRPMLRLGLGLTWILSALIGSLQPYGQVASMLSKLGLNPALATATIVGSCALDIAIGLALLLRFRPALMACIQIAVVLGYTFALSIAAPILWLDPFGPLIKNFVFLIAAMILAAIERDR